MGKPFPSGRAFSTTMGFKLCENQLDTGSRRHKTRLGARSTAHENALIVLPAWLILYSAVLGKVSLLLYQSFVPMDALSGRNSKVQAVVEGVADREEAIVQHVKAATESDIVKRAVA